MDDQMIDLMAGDELLRRRLLAYADLRLSPDLTTSSRLRARVMAVAHRHASLARADAALTLLPRPAGNFGAPPVDEMGVAARAARRSAGHHHGRRRLVGVMLAASMGAALAIGSVFAARPGGPLYDARLRVEALTLPGHPSARAVAELDRLRERLREIGEASRAGDTAGAMAALAAYQSIVDEASASAILAHDDVAAAVLETGVGRNVEVLRALAAKVPATAGAAIVRAVDAAIARSTDAVERIEASQPDGDGDDGAGPGPASPPRATTDPAPTPSPAKTTTAKPRPTHKPVTPTPDATPRSAATPERTPRPRVNQGQLEPSAPAEAPTDGGEQDEDD